MLHDQSIGVEGVDGIAIEVELRLPGQAEGAAYRPIGTQGRFAGLIDGVQGKEESGEKEPTVEAERPINNAVIELAFERVDGILKENVWAVDVVGNVGCKEGGQVVLEYRDRLLNFGCILLRLGNGV